LDGVQLVCENSIDGDGSERNGGKSGQSSGAGQDCSVIETNDIRKGSKIVQKLTEVRN
jgi:hypothetical protein